MTDQKPKTAFRFTGTCRTRRVLRTITIESVSIIDADKAAKLKLENCRMTGMGRER